MGHLPRPSSERLPRGGAQGNPPLSRAHFVAAAQGEPRSPTPALRSRWGGRQGSPVGRAGRTRLTRLRGSGGPSVPVGGGTGSWGRLLTGTPRAGGTSSRLTRAPRDREYITLGRLGFTLGLVARVRDVGSRARVGAGVAPEGRGVRHGGSSRDPGPDPISPPRLDVHPSGRARRETNSMSPAGAGCRPVAEPLVARSGAGLPRPSWRGGVRRPTSRSSTSFPHVTSRLRDSRAAPESRRIGPECLHSASGEPSKRATIASGLLRGRAPSAEATTCPGRILPSSLAFGDSGCDPS